MLYYLGASAVPTLIFLLLGIFLLVLEMFTPGVGAAGIGGLVCLVAVIVLQLGWGNPAAAALIVAITLVLFILALLVFIRSFREGRLSRSAIVLRDAISGDAADAKREESSLLGATGTAVTPLRPSGIAEFEGKRLQVSAAGAFIPAGSKVTVTGQNGLTVLVSPADGE